MLIKEWRELLTSGHSIVQGGVSSPGHPVVGGEGARPLGLVEQQGEVQHLAVGVGGGVVGLETLHMPYLSLCLQKEFSIFQITSEVDEAV